MVSDIHFSGQHPALLAMTQQRVTLSIWQERLQPRTASHTAQTDKLAAPGPFADKSAPTGNEQLSFILNRVRQEPDYSYSENISSLV